jgi:DNA replicative helicase MCM subunit Mcm2 (Cdc46/Mcm family)
MDDAEAVVRLFDIYMKATWTDPYTGKIDLSAYEGMASASLLQQAAYVPKIIEAMYRDGRAEVDAVGERCVRKGALVDELVARSDGKIVKERALLVIQAALQNDYIWSPTVDKIKLTGANANRVFGAESQTLNTP